MDPFTEREINGELVMDITASVLMPRSAFLDADTWTDMASSRGLRMPSWNLPPTPRLMRRWLKRIGLSWEEYKIVSGDGRMTDFARRNPRWPLCAWIGLLLEWTEGVFVGVNEGPEIHETAEMVAEAI